MDTSGQKTMSLLRTNTCALDSTLMAGDFSAIDPNEVCEVNSVIHHVLSSEITNLQNKMDRVRSDLIALCQAHKGHDRSNVKLPEYFENDVIVDSFTIAKEDANKTVSAQYVNFAELLCKVTDEENQIFIDEDNLKICTVKKEDGGGLLAKLVNLIIIESEISLEEKALIEECGFTIHYW